MSAEIPRIHGIYRYPVKGLSPEALTGTRLAVGETLPADRLYAIENGPSGFDPAAPRYQPKQRYLMLMRNERLARLRTRYEDANHTLAIELDGREAARGDLHTADGRATIERFFADFCADELRGPPRLLHAPGFSFSDVARKGRVDRQFGVRGRDRKSGGDAGASATLSRQPLRDGLASLARVRSGRAGDRDRQGGTAQDRQADRALCRDRRRSRHRGSATSRSRPR
jgi:hypothetical protein